MTRKKSEESGAGQPLPLTRPVLSKMTATDLINAGESAAQTLGSPAVNVAVNLLREELYQQIALSHPQEQKKRESAYLELHALLSMLDKLKLMYRRAEQELDDIQRAPEREQAEYYENQGFN